MNCNVIILGAGASGLICAAAAGRRGRRVLVLDHAKTACQKVLMSGGGRCNFTNLTVDDSHYLCQTPHFTKSALSRFTPWDFLELILRYRIRYHEREHGQLFCDESARDIQRMLLAECEQAGVTIRLNCTIEQVRKKENQFLLQTSQGAFQAESLVVATGGRSIPSSGASPLGYQLAEQFGVPVRPTSPGLVPLTLQPEDKARLAELSGIAVQTRVSTETVAFTESLLFTHRGVSGPVILQISNYWHPGQALQIDLLPDLDLFETLSGAGKSVRGRQLKTLLGEWLPKRLVAALLPPELAERPLRELSHTQLRQIAKKLQQWQLTPNGTEGYRTAEVTRGGVDCDAISSKTFEARQVPGLFFIGEVLDVTGWLGGYNFQWAWSSGWCAGQVV